ncbi:membrane protein insertase YidC, partial [Acidithiobacillus sp.]
SIFFYPSAISYRSMANMRKLQPKLEKLKQEVGDDRQKLGVAMMELYRSEKVNPMAGCLPIVLQMPFFIALYWVLVESVSLRQAPFILWIHDLAIPDPYFILPLLMGVSMFFQQRLNPAPVDPMQKRIMSALPVVFAVFFSFFPAGLVLYWLTNNVVSIGQQYLITRHIMAAKD